MKKTLMELLFPPKCASCDRLLPFRGIGHAPSSILCDDCRAEWEAEMEAHCAFCGERVGHCKCLPETLERAHCLGFYKLLYYRHDARSVQNRMIYHIKDRPSKALISFFASKLSERVDAILKDADLTPGEVVLMPIPRSYRARALSGSDQAVSLACAIGERMEIAVSRAIGRRRKSHRQQKHLKTKERIANAKKAYFLSRDRLPTGKAVILVDDIVTTGATMSAVAKLLSREGVHSVYCLAICSNDSNRTAQVAQPVFRI